jgi:hypothetical protein
MLLFNNNMHKHKFMKILNIYILLYLCKSVSPIKKKFVPPHQKSWFSPYPSVYRSFELFKGCIRPDVMANRPTALQGSRRILRSSASVRMKWQYHLDASQCSTSKNIFFADTDMERQLQPSG